MQLHGKRAAATLSFGILFNPFEGRFSIAKIYMSWKAFAGFDLLDEMHCECDCIACLEDLGSMGNGLLIYMMAQHLEKR